MTHWPRLNRFNADWLRLRALETLHLLGLTIGIPLSPCVKGPNFALKLAPCRIGARISITGFADRLCPGPIVPSGLTIGAQAERYGLISEVSVRGRSEVRHWEHYTCLLHTSQL